MNVILFGINPAVDKLIIEAEHHILMYADNDLRRCKEGYSGVNVIHPIDIPRYDYDAIVITDDIMSQTGRFHIYEKIEQLQLYGVNNDKIYGLNNDELMSFHSLKDVLHLKGDISYQRIFEIVHPRSILNTHREYVIERCKGRKLYIYGIGYEASCLTKMFNSIGITVEKYISDKTNDTSLNAIETIETIDLVYEELDSIFILVADESESYGVTRKKLLSIGIREDVDFTYHAEIPGTAEPFYYDVTLSYSRIRDEIEGFELYGDKNAPDAITIVVLGGSTTESQLFYVKGWVPFFAEYLRHAGISAKVYCGGVSGYTSTQELLKFERDVINLSPDIVISYSGVNDLYMFPSEKEIERVGKPFITKFQVQFIQQILEKLSRLHYSLPTPDIPDWEIGGRQTVFYGLQTDKTASCFWIDNMRMMNALAREFGIAFFAFFQPFRFNGYYLSTPTQEIIHRRRDPSCVPNAEGEKIYGKKTEVEEIRKQLRNYNYITDLSELFLEESEIYYDSVHVYEKGNQIIARRICDTIIRNINLRGK